MLSARGPTGVKSTVSHIAATRRSLLPKRVRCWTIWTSYRTRTVTMNLKQCWVEASLPILASRGCARTCSFCSIHTFYRAAPGRIVRTRKPAEVVREMRMLYEERGITIFLFQDDDFPLFGNVWRRWANEFVDELNRSGLPERVIWKMNCRADAVDRDLFIKMRDAGLYLVYMGLESGSEQGLETLHKQITVEQNLRAVDILKSIGLMWEY